MTYSIFCITSHLILSPPAIRRAAGGSAGEGGDDTLSGFSQP